MTETPQRSRLRAFRRRRALFLHIQKTAGTSIVDAAGWHYGRKRLCSHGDFLLLGQSGCNSRVFLSGHFGYAFARPLMHRRFCFTFLRDPLDRLISLHAYLNASPHHLPPNVRHLHPLSLETFLSLADEPDLRHHIWNSMVWQLTYGFTPSSALQKIDGILPHDHPGLLGLALANLRTFDHVGLQENFTSDSALIFKALGMPKGIKVNSNRSLGRTSRPDVPRALLSRMEDMTQLDQRLYDQVRETFRDGRLQIAPIQLWKMRLAERRARRAARLNALERGCPPWQGEP